MDSTEKIVVILVVWIVVCVIASIILKQDFSSLTQNLSLGSKYTLTDSFSYNEDHPILTIKNDSDIMVVVDPAVIEGIKNRS